MQYESLLEYDTIFVQRLHEWSDADMLTRLSKIGKRVVYDIDDDIFSIPESNPVHGMMNNDAKMAARECMKIADLVTVSTNPLRDKLKHEICGIRTEVIPNAMNLSGWLETRNTGSPDGRKRIFWQGSSTHDQDWNECFDAVLSVMSKRQEVILLLMGFLPSRIRQDLDQPEFNGRIELMEAMEADEYFKIIRYVRADVGLAPINDTEFNRSKSCIKWMENAMIGMPTVASNVAPYSNEIQHGKNGFLCSSKKEWVESIEKCLDNERVRKGIVENARSRIRSRFDIENVAKSWNRVLSV